MVNWEMMENIINFTLPIDSNPSQWIKEHLKDANFVKEMDAKFYTHDVRELTNIFDIQLKKQGLDATKLQAGKKYSLNFENNMEKAQNQPPLAQNTKHQISQKQEEISFSATKNVNNPFSQQIKEAELIDRLKQSVVSDGEIGKFMQGEVGDCSLLANIQAISEKPAGKKIIKETIKRLPDGNFEVRFKGEPDEVYSVSKEEFFREENKKLSKGDDDVKIIEIAVRKYLKEKYPERANKKDKDILDGGFDSLRLLVGNQTFIVKHWKSEAGYIKYDYNLKSQEKYSIKDVKSLMDNISANQEDYAIQIVMNNVNERNTDGIYHSSTVHSIDRTAKKISLINPADNAKIVEFDDETVFNNLHGINLAKLSGNQIYSTKSKKNFDSIWNKLKAKSIILSEL